MPLPKPKKDETKEEFVGRCMSELSKEFPNSAQRNAVCFKQWENKKNISKFSFGMKIKESSLLKRNSKKSGKTEKRIVVGYAATYEVFENGDTLQLTREALDNAKNDLLQYNTVLFNHDKNRPIGHIIETDTDEKGLLVKFILSNTEDVIWEQIQDGTISKLSFQGKIPPDGYTVIEKEGEEPIIQVNKIKLVEAGLVSVPGNVEAETLTHYTESSLDIEEMINNSKIISNSDSDVFKEVEKTPEYVDITLFTYLNELLKKAEEESDESKKRLISNLIYTLQSIKNVVADLQLLGGKLESSDRSVIDRATNILKELEIENIKESEYDLSDESDERPIFQLNSEIDSSIGFSEEKNTFRKQILKYGRWFHWGAPSGVLKVDEALVDNIIENFNKKVIENVYVPLTHTDDPSKNTGKVLKLEKTATGLDAIIEIKDKEISEKIKSGLISCISASIDPNYRVKKNNKFVGTALLHAALVAEPFIKGMSKFVTLTDNIENRQIVLLEDTEPNMLEMLKSISIRLNNIEESILNDSSTKEMKTKKVKEEIKEEEIKTEEKEVTEEKEEDIDIEASKDKYKECMATEMKKGKEMKDAAKICKIKIKEEYNVDFSDSDLEEKSTEEDEKETEEKEMITEEKEEVEKKVEEKVEEKEEEKVDEEESIDFSDVERKYNEYLRAGKVVPAQKESFMNLYISAKKIELSDKKVEASKDFDNFMANMPKIINFGEEGSSNAGEKATEGKPAIEEMPMDVKELYSKMGLSDEMANVSWKEARKLSEEEKANRESSLF